MNVVLKSGGNDFHGSVFEFHRNGKLDARNFFAPSGESKPKYIRNQFGGSLGGPINRDSTFFFADYEGTRSREGITRVSNVPTLLERQGNFSQTRDIFGNPVFIRNPFLPRDPLTGAPLFRCDAGDQTGCFAGNIVPGLSSIPSVARLPLSIRSPIATCRFRILFRRLPKQIPTTASTRESITA